jgi:hypothetical protein
VSAPRRLTRAGAALVCAAAACALLLPSCTGSPPEILQILWEVRVEQDRESGTVFESLSLFVKPNDPDGSGDLDELYVIQDQEELFWSLDPDSWLESGAGQELWIGSNSLRLPDGSALPNGEYRILLRDVGGEAAEQSIRVEAPSLEEARRFLPEVTVEQGSILLHPADRRYTLWLYSLDGAHVASVEVQGDTQPLGALRASYPALQPGFRFKVYCRVEALNLGVVTGPFAVGP